VNRNLIQQVGISSLLIDKLDLKWLLYNLEVTLILPLLSDYIQKEGKTGSSTRKNFKLNNVNLFFPKEDLL